MGANNSVQSEISNVTINNSTDLVTTTVQQCNKAVSQVNSADIKAGGNVVYNGTQTNTSGSGGTCGPTDTMANPSCAILATCALASALNQAGSNNISAADQQKLEALQLSAGLAQLNNSVNTAVQNYTSANKTTIANNTIQSCMMTVAQKNLLPIVAGGNATVTSTQNNSDLNTCVLNALTAQAAANGVTLTTGQTASNNQTTSTPILGSLGAIGASIVAVICLVVCCSCIVCIFLMFGGSSKSPQQLGGRKSGKKLTSKSVKLPKGILDTLFN